MFAFVNPLLVNAILLYDLAHQLERLSSVTQGLNIVLVKICHLAFGNSWDTLILVQLCSYIDDIIYNNVSVIYVNIIYL